MSPPLQAAPSARGRQRAPEGAGPKGPRTPTAISKGTQHWHAWCAMCLPPMPIELYKIAHHVDESFVNFKNARVFFAKALKRKRNFRPGRKDFSTWSKSAFRPRAKARCTFSKDGHAQAPGNCDQVERLFWVEALDKTPFSTSNTVRHL